MRIKFAAVNVMVEQIAHLRGEPRKGPECVPKPPFSKAAFVKISLDGYCPPLAIPSHLR